MQACDLVEWITNAELKKNVSHGGAAVTKAIKELYDEGKLERQGGGKSGNPYEYRRVESPFSVLPLGTEQRTETDATDAKVEEGEWDDHD
jgi:hypothetical protein